MVIQPLFIIVPLAIWVIAFIVYELFHPPMGINEGNC